MDQSPKHFPIDPPKPIVNLGDKVHFETLNTNSNLINNLNSIHQNFPENLIVSPFFDRYNSSKNYFQFFGHKDFDPGFSPLNPKTFYDNFNIYGNRLNNNHYFSRY